ncbi:hypothetical protein EIP91_012314 [Steccherinum ochraceum]|uniref:Uncharacterized protein n=1 Tax=Steccherinum ochraceum TaxID=92696 RepID=A0A4R0RQ68_9APHY|nr:hypothetical protein EIP91_012314 [Steccherinum ochraceum]
MAQTVGPPSGPSPITAARAIPGFLEQALWANSGNAPLSIVGTVGYERGKVDMVNPS